MFRYFKIIGALVCFLFILSGCGNSPTHTITGFNCSGASVGSQIVIYGTGFDSNAPNNNLVAFTGAGGTPIIVPATSSFATSLTVTVPPGATTGVILISTDGGPEVTSPTNFTVLPQPTFSPSTGAVGTIITITGTNFDSTTPTYNLITFTGAQSVPAFTCPNPTTLTVAVPAGATPGVITVDVDGETYILTSANSFSISQ
jgi:hypothetical protein